MDDSNGTIVELLRQELEFRRSKQWDIFSWCSTLLVAIAGGVIALEKQQTSLLHPAQRVVVSLAVATLASYGFIWHKHHEAREDEIRRLITQETMCKIWKPRKKVPGARAAVVVLGIAALAAIWVPFQ